jgi:hypothetical protein
MKRPALVVLLTLASVSAVSVACATSGGGGGGGFGAVDTTKFPSRDKLAEVAARELPALKTDVRSDLASWTLKGPMPDALGDAPVAPGGLNDILISSVSAARTSKNLECAARELAELMVAHDEKQPESRLRSWLIARCGVTTGDVSTQWLSWKKVPEKMLDGDVWKDSKESVAKMLSDHKDAHLGVAFARNLKTHTALLLVAGSGPPQDARIDAMSQVVAPDAPKVVLSGAVTDANAEVVYAYATKGLLEASECELDLAVVLPRFRFTCAVDAADVSARIDVAVRKKGRVLGDMVAELLVVRDVAASMNYREAIYVDANATGAATSAAASAATSAATSASLAAPGELDVLAAINGVRAAAGSQPLRATAAQSEAVKKVAPHYFANMFAEDVDAEVADVVALGLMAGWDVTELTIHDAGFATLLDVSGGGDDLLGYALDRPMHRSILLDPKMSAAAVGPVTMESGMKGALVITYEALVPPVDHAKAASEVFEKLRAVRTERGLGVTGSIPTEKVMLDAAARMQKGEDIETVANSALQQSVDIMQRPFTIWMMEIHDVEHMAFPDELLTARTTYVAISVATRKRPKSAWGSTVVLILGFVDETRVASAASVTREDVRSSR